MNRCFYFGTNLKMYKTASETSAYLTELAALTEDLTDEPLVRLVIPSFTSLGAAGTCAHKSVRLGAQNMHWEECGQFTGEVSPRMLRDLGCIDIVEIGHSERRHVFGETDEQCGKKVLSALANGFTALLCVGETAEEKHYGVSDETLARQIKIGLFGVDWEMLEAKRVWLAYEPVWAIGVNGVPAPAEYVQERMHRMRETVEALYPGLSQNVPLLFGGSVNPENADGYAAQADVDGLFVGRAAWTAPTFNALLRQVLPVWKKRCSAL